jgi:hypothetical protein
LLAERRGIDTDFSAMSDAADATGEDASAATVPASTTTISNGSRVCMAYRRASAKALSLGSAGRG